MKKILLFLFLLILIGGGVAGYFVGYLPYTRIKAKGLAVAASGSELKKAFKENNIDLLNEKMKSFSGVYTAFEKEAATVYWATFIPYVADFKKGVEAGHYVILAAQESIEAITPYADLIGFKKGQASFVEKSAEGRLQTAVLTLDKVLTKIDLVSENIHQAEVRINSIDSKKYPETLGKTKVRATIENLKEQFVGMASLFVDAKPLLKKLPDILGKSKEKTYLLLFQNDKERRATGGFLTAYATFKIKDGKISIDRSDDIYSLDASIADHPRAPREILTYHINVPLFQIRDSNLSPDLVKSIELFNSLYKKSGNRVVYDGIIMLDSKILVDMLTIFGDTEVQGVNFTAKTDKRCDCPQVIYQLFDMVDRPTPYLRENRKGILGSLMYALFYKAIGFSPSKYWGTLAQTMFQNLDEKHILLYFVDPETQAAVERMNYAGRIREYSGDYLHINNVNFAGAKSNLFVKEGFTSKATSKNGVLEKELTVEFKNPYPHSDCNLERGNLCLNATLRNWIRIYVPLGSKLIDFKGSKMKVQEYTEFGKTVFEGFLEVPTEGMAKVVVTYTLPPSVTAQNYRLYIQKQPGVMEQNLRVELNGKKLLDGVLTRDLEIKN